MWSKLTPDGFSEDNWPSETFEYISLSEASDGEIGGSKTTRLEDAQAGHNGQFSRGTFLLVLFDQSRGATDS